MRSLFFATAMAMLCAASGSEPLDAQDRSRNSTRKIRPEPSELAAKAGTWVNWRDDLDQALAESKESGKPLFWYVPTLFRSPMDRQVEIDRYMMAGPFSWPACIDALNERFVPVKQAGSRELMQRFDGLRPGTFIEPGFLVLDGEENVLAQWDEITTLHPEWWRRRLSEALKAASAEPLSAWPVDSGESEAVRLYRAGVELFFETRMRGGHELAWKELIERFPDHPLAAKAQAELEGHGPLVNGFEPQFVAPDASWFDAATRGTRSPRGDWTREQLREWHGVFFRQIRSVDGGFEDSRYDFGGTDSLPNVHVAVTSVVARALLEWSADSKLADAESELLFSAIPYLADDDNLNLDDSDELVWAYLYRLELRNRWLELNPDSKGELLPKIQEDHDALVAMQNSRGAWSHEYPNPFVTASVLIALAGAREHGVETESLVISKAIGFLKSCRTEDGAITYGAPRGAARARVQGGVGRMPLIEHALLSWGEGSQESLTNALEVSFQYEDELFKVRKYDDHASRFGYGGFFFWYDLKVRWEALQSLEDEAKRDEWMAMQRKRILTLPEFDGCFVDSHELGRCYGTAMAWLAGL